MRNGSTAGVAVVGAGWAGVVAARELHDRGYPVHLFEQQYQLGGHSRAGTVNGVVFEPHGPHIFHTSSADVARYVGRFGMVRSYEHRVLTEVFLDDEDDTGVLLSWPPQMDELKGLRIWPEAEAELARLPEVPSATDLEAYCESIMGPTLYRLFVRDYTVKQWDRHPAELSYRYFPGRVAFRTDGDRRLFRDTWEFYPPNGAQEVIERIAAPLPITLGREILACDLPELERDFRAVVVTAPLDVFAGQPDRLEWRGVRTVSRYLPMDGDADTATPAYVVNRPSLRRPFTRTVETKHATAQRICATVVSEEYPGAAARHYPVPTVTGANERRNDELKQWVQDHTEMRVYFCGRLANYAYINQDVAIAQSLACADEIAEFLRTG